MDDLKSALESIELGRQLIKRLNHANPSAEFEQAVANLNAAITNIKAGGGRVIDEATPVATPKKKSKKKAE